MGENRNLLLAIFLTVAIFALYEVLIMGPARERRLEYEAQHAEQIAATDEDPLPEGEGDPAADPIEASSARADTRDAAVAMSADRRLRIDAPAVSGSILLDGARFDDLQLLRYREELAEDSPPVTLFNPQNGPAGYYAAHGWNSVSGRSDLPSPNNTPWRVIEGEVLTPETPVTLGYETEDGLLFRRTIAVDGDYLFTITDRVTNDTGDAQTLFPYGVIRRYGVPEDLTNFMILHEGAVGVLNGDSFQRKYRRMRRQQERAGVNANGRPAPFLSENSEGGWLGYTDKYWLAALAPGADAEFTGEMLVRERADGPMFQAQYQMTRIDVPAGESVEVTTRLFAGAKRVDVLRRYQEEFDIPGLDMAVDWGNFWFFTRPFFYTLDYFGRLTGNFGIAILILTVLVKILFFPLANSAFKSMARMKALQPKVQELRERFKADPKRQQQEMMQLYQREKVNPVAGCLPILLQIPVFYALYKTLFVTIEMRHAPFFGWIQDLSARDPTNMWNLFGLLPYDPASLPLLGAIIGGTGALALGAWPLMMGATMAAMQTLNPPPPDKFQQRLFAMMPLVFMFILAPFAAGLVIYWTWNNTLTFTQQYIIMRRQGVDTPIGSFLRKRWDAVFGGSGASGGTPGGSAGSGGGDT